MTDKEKQKLKDSIHFTGKNTFRIDGEEKFDDFDKQFDKAIQKILVKKYATGEILNPEISAAEYQNLKIAVIVQKLKEQGVTDEEIADIMIGSYEVADQMAKEHITHVNQFSIVGSSDREEV